VNRAVGFQRAWTTVAHSAGATVAELVWHDDAGVCHVLARVTDDLTGESVTLSGEQWQAITGAWAKVWAEPANERYGSADQ
jgi:hypothetical protein